MWAIFETRQAALQFNADVMVKMGWPSADGTTIIYGVPQKHPTKDQWSMFVKDYAQSELPPGTQTVDQLSDDWTPQQ